MSHGAVEPITVLLVEDDQDLRDTIAGALGLAGYEVVDANSAEAAIASSVDGGQDVDIVLTDVVLPEMSGVELVRVLCSRRPGLKALFMSGHSHDVLREHGLENAGAGFLLKPFSLDDLEQKIREQLPASPGEGAGGIGAGSGRIR